jgi:hypothetical protein
MLKLIEKRKKAIEVMGWKESTVVVLVAAVLKDGATMTPVLKDLLLIPLLLLEVILGFNNC